MLMLSMLVLDAMLSTFLPRVQNHCCGRSVVHKSFSLTAGPSPVHKHLVLSRHSSSGLHHKPAHSSSMQSDNLQDYCMCSDKRLALCKLEGTCQHSQARSACCLALTHLLYVRVGRAVHKDTTLHALAANARRVALPDLVNLLVLLGHDIVKE